MKTKQEFRAELEERLRGRRYDHMLIDQYVRITLETALEVMAEFMVEAGVLRNP